MSIEHVLMFALVVFVFYHFMCRCNRVEGVINCHQVLSSTCGYTAGSGSCADCNDCLSQNKGKFDDVGCWYKTAGEFCSLPEQQQENTLYLLNDGELKEDGKAKLMEILGKYRSGLMNGEDNELRLRFGISNGYDNININIDDLRIVYGDNSINMYGDPNLGPEVDGTLGLAYYLVGKYQYISMIIYAKESGNQKEYLSINLSDEPDWDDFTKEHSIKFSYYLC